LIAFNIHLSDLRDDDLDKLVRALGLTFASPLNEDKILVAGPITA
jgi:hypothetical protein